MGVYKRGSHWYIDFYYQNKRIREVVTVEGKDPASITFRDAERALAIRKAEIATGKFKLATTEKPVKFEKLVEAYLKWVDENHKSPERDYTCCKNLLAYFGGGKNIYSFTLWGVEKFKSERKIQGRKPETINKELGALRRMFNLALAGTLSVKIGRNPIQGVKLLKVPPTKVRALKEGEFQKLYSAASEGFRPILLCAYMTGMRRSEIARLKWEDVDFEDGYIYIAETKNGEPRSIPIVEPLLSTLRELEGRAICEYVFTTPDGKPYTSLTSWKRTWTTALRNSGIEKCRFHDLRHTFISNLIVGEKEDFATVMALSGHKDISMLKRYSHTQEEAKRAAVQKLEKRAKSAIPVTKPVTGVEDGPSVDNAVIGLTTRNQ